MVFTWTLLHFCSSYMINLTILFSGWRSSKSEIDSAILTEFWQRLYRFKVFKCVECGSKTLCLVILLVERGLSRAYKQLSFQVRSPYYPGQLKSYASVQHQSCFLSMQHELPAPCRSLHFNFQTSKQCQSRSFHSIYQSAVRWANPATWPWKGNYRLIPKNNEKSLTPTGFESMTAGLVHRRP